MRYRSRYEINLIIFSSSLFVYSKLKSDTMEIAAAILSMIKSTNATMHTINVQYISYLCSMPLHQHCWNSCVFPLRYLWNQHFYIINVRRRHFEWNTGCFCAIEMKEENTCAHTNNIGNNISRSTSTTIKFCFYKYTHQNFSDYNYHLVVYVVLVAWFVDQPANIFTHFVDVALLVRNAHDFTG